MRTKKDLAMLGFEMKLSQRNLIYKVVFDALGDIHHDPLLGEELPSILLDDKDILFESNIIQILVQSLHASIQTFVGYLK